MAGELYPLITGSILQWSSGREGGGGRQDLDSSIFPNTPSGTICEGCDIGTP